MTCILAEAGIASGVHHPSSVVRPSTIDYFSGTDDQNLIKFGRKYPQVTRIQIYTNDGADPPGAGGVGLKRVKLAMFI